MNINKELFFLHSAMFSVRRRSDSTASAANVCLRERKNVSYNYAKAKLLGCSL